MNRESTTRLAVNLIRAITVLTIIVALAAAFVLASEIALILFLGVLFGVFLTKLAGRVASHSPVGYRGALSIVVVSLLLVFTGTVSFFFVQINQQVEAASGKIDEGMKELRDLIEEYPALEATLASTPVVSAAIEVETDRSKSGEKTDSGFQSSEENKTSNKKSGSSQQSGIQLDSIPEPVKQAAGSIGAMFRTTFGLVVNSLLIFFVGLFLAVSPGSYRDGIVCLVPKPKRKRIAEVLDSTSETLWRWLIGRFGSMLATGLGAFLLLLVLGVPMAGTLGILTALLTFIPNIGAAVALGLAILFALPQGVGIVGAVVGGYFVLQLFESYVVTPLIQQKAASLPPALLISFQAIMGVLFGFTGAAVASPLLAAGKTMVERLYIEDYLQSDEGAGDASSHSP
ncbi:AI-2E family transporter [Stieleria sp. ICT_E10.1]|uniref:AI-2E family transporter n=1 Tax=Stieleria sedimenti TaxID=2976331 RepID=UPI00218048F3|nr:AI-2E family transporter [Stieleria sedimenti]MCS7470562.1 AI-2E family transporter [Stieleria sedimenti]